MNDLALINQKSNPLSKPAIILRDLWKALEVKEQYANWYQRQLEDFTQGIDFVGIKVNLNPTNSTYLNDHAVTIEVGKHIALMSRTENGKKYRQKLIELEESTLTPRVPQTYNEAIIALASSIMENTKLERSLIEQKPKVDTYDKICQCENTFPVRDVSRFYDMRPSDLTNLLIEHDWVFRYKKGGKLSVKDKGFQQKLVVQKLFLATNSYGVDVVVKNVHITTKGILKIAKLLNIVQDDEFLENIENSFNIE